VPLPQIIKYTEIHKLLFRRVSGPEDINILHYPRILKMWKHGCPMHKEPIGKYFKFWWSHGGDCEAYSILGYDPGNGMWYIGTNISEEDGSRFFWNVGTYVPVIPEDFSFSVNLYCNFLLTS
jgi:hypothetical protein